MVRPHWAASPLQPGSQLGPYRIVAPVARGGMAIVYRAIHAVLGRPVAIKVLSALAAADAVARARFRREAHAVARLRHPHIVALFDAGEIEGLPYLVTEFASGGPLASQCAVPCPAPARIARALAIARDVGSALDYAHRRGVLHRDVKPSNILLTAEGDLILADFGLAQVREATIRLTQTGDFWGSPCYTSPEQAQGLPTDGRADLYSLGVVLYEFLTGVVPFAAESAVATVLAHVHQPPPRVCDLQPDLPPAIEPVLARALAKAPDDRFQCAADLAEAIDQAAQSFRGRIVSTAPYWSLPAPGDDLSAAAASSGGPLSPGEEPAPSTAGTLAAATIAAHAVQPATTSQVPAGSGVLHHRTGRRPTILTMLAAALAALIVLVSLAGRLASPEVPSGESGLVPPRLTEASPPNGASGVPLQPVIELRFSHPMEPVSVETALDLEPPAAVRYEWQNAGTRLLIVPSEPLAPQTAYVLRLDEGARDLQGQEVQNVPVERHFITVAAPAILERVVVVQGSADDQGGFGGLARPLFPPIPQSEPGPTATAVIPALPGPPSTPTP